MIEVNEIDTNSLEFDGFEWGEMDMADLMLVSGNRTNGKTLNDEELDYISDNYREWLYDVAYQQLYT